MNLVRGAAIFGFLGVALGAFGAHGLKARLGPEMLEIYKTGVLYHLLHALAALAVALTGHRLPGRRVVVGLFMAGIVIFSGSLYALALTRVRILGAITPIGGVAFMAGWAVLVFWGESRSSQER